MLPKAALPPLHNGGRMNFNFTEVMGFIASVLQFVVAGYALRLNRIFGTARVGWSLFWAFSLLALLHLFQSINVVQYRRAVGGSRSR